MAFSQEVRDFIAGYQAVTDVGNKKKGLDLDEKRTDSDIEYKNAIIDIQRQQLDMQRQKMADANARAGAAAAASAAAAADKAAEKAEADRAAAAEELLSGATLSAPNTTVDTTTNKDTAYPVLPEYNIDGKYALGGLVAPEEDEPPLIQKGTGGARGIGLPAMTRSVEPATLPPSDSAPATAPRAALPTPGPGDSPAVASTAPTGPRVTDTGPRLPAGETPVAPEAPAALPDAPLPDEAQGKLRRPETEPTRVIIKRSSQAAADVMDAQEAWVTAPRTAVGGPAQPPADLLSGQGAMTPQELEEIRKQIDPNGMIPAYLKGAAALSEAYTYFMEKGQPEKARAIATKMLAGERQLSQTLGVLVMDAIERGDLTAASKLFGDAVDRFPSGHEVFFAPDDNGVLTYTVREFGNVKEQGKLTGAQFMELAGQVADGSLYMKALAQFAASGKSGEATVDFNTAVDDVAAAYAPYAKAKSALDEAVSAGDDEETIAALQAEVDATAGAYTSAYRQALNVGLQTIPSDSKKSQVASTSEVRRAINDAVGIEFMPPAAQAAPPASVGDDGGTGGTGGGESIPPVPEPSQRVVGQMYRAPNGKVGIWRGTGWEEVK